MPSLALSILWIGEKNSEIKKFLDEHIKKDNADSNQEMAAPRIVEKESLIEGRECINYDEPFVFELIIIDTKLLKDETDYELLHLIKEMDPEIELLLVAHKLTFRLYQEVGELGAKVISYEELKNDYTHVRNILLKIFKKYKDNLFAYDHLQKTLANEVAENYEKMETERPGTVAYWLFEEELIKKIVKAKEKEKEKETDPVIKILDIGCGTGRFARVILESSKNALVTCVDFSGKMLSQARAILENIEENSHRFILQRALAQKLPENYKDYDLVILGFGFPCYSPTSEVLKEASRVLRNDGLLFASVYNHLALTYDNEEFNDKNSTARPITTLIDREASKLQIPNAQKIDARTFTRGQFARELRSANFHVQGYLTFPVIYSTFECSDINIHSETDERDKCYNNPQFSFSLWEVDRQLSWILKEGGFYNIFIASKTRDKHIDDIVASLKVHTEFKIIDP